MIFRKKMHGFMRTKIGQMVHCALDSCQLRSSATNAIFDDDTSEPCRSLCSSLMGNEEDLPYLEINFIARLDGDQIHLDAGLSY